MSTSVEKAEQIIADEKLEEEKLWDELENEEIPGYIRDARLEQLKTQAKHFEQMKNKDYGSYTELADEKEFLNLTTKTDKCIVHFFHPDFRRCAIMDTHLENLAKMYFETKFAKMNVNIAKFMVAKLKVQILPAIFCFKSGIVVDKVIGFDDLGNSDSFKTEILEQRFGKAGVIDYVPEENQKGRHTIFQFSKTGPSNDDSSGDSDDD